MTYNSFFLDRKFIGVLTLLVQEIIVEPHSTILALPLNPALISALAPSNLFLRQECGSRIPSASWIQSLCLEHHQAHRLGGLEMSLCRSIIPPHIELHAPPILSNDSDP